MSGTPAITLSQIYHVVLPLLLRAGQILVTRQKELIGLPVKSRHERGDAIEKEITTLMNETLLQLFPNHTVFTPGAPASETPEWQWITTPLDGRRYYFRGLPLYSVALALKHEGELVLGVVVEPAARTTFHAIKGEGAFCNDRAIVASEEKSLANAFAYISGRNADVVKQFTVAMTMSGARACDFDVASLGLCYLAAGTFDIFIAPKDDESLTALLAGLVIAKESGATVSDIEGKPLKAASSSVAALIATPAIYKAALAALKK